MPFLKIHPKIVLAILLGTATGIAPAQIGSRATEVIKPQPDPKAALSPNPCEGAEFAVLTFKNFLVVNRTSEILQCRMKNPAFGGWSDFAPVPAGGRLIDRELGFSEIQVQCKPPARIVPVRVYPGLRYALLRKPGNPEIRLVQTVPGR